jgi:hypothetical protein
MAAFLLTGCYLARRIRFWPWSNAPGNGNAVIDSCHFALR